MDGVDRALLDKITALVRPLREVLDPLFVGLDRIPRERPLLFVGNHTIYGVLDVPFLAYELHAKKGITLRGLGDHAHFRLPGWRTLLRRGGVVPGTRENCGKLMAAGEAVIVYPGGAREVAKRKGERNKLLWKERMGFARMALAHGCTIVPFASIGIDDAYDIVFDADDVMRSPLGALIRRFGLREDAIMPLARGIGPTLMPRPERLYFSIGEPIAARDYADQDPDAAAPMLRDRTRDAVEWEIMVLEELRRADPKRALLPRLEAAARRMMGG